MRDKAQRTVEGLGLHIVSLYLQFQSGNAQIAAGVFKKSHEAPADSAATVFRREVQFCNGGYLAAEFQVIAEGQDGVSDHFPLPINGPDPAESRVF